MARADPKLPAWFRQPGEPMPLAALKSGCLGLAVGVGTYDANGNPKGSGWW